MQDALCMTSLRGALIKEWLLRSERTTAKSTSCFGTKWSKMDAVSEDTGVDNKLFLSLFKGAFCCWRWMAIHWFDGLWPAPIQCCDWYWSGVDAQQKLSNPSPLEEIRPLILVGFFDNLKCQNRDVLKKFCCCNYPHLVLLLSCVIRLDPELICWDKKGWTKKSHSQIKSQTVSSHPHQR